MCWHQSLHHGIHDGIKNAYTQMTLDTYAECRYADIQAWSVSQLSPLGGNANISLLG